MHTPARVRLDPVGAGLVALITVDVPPANTIDRATLEDLGRMMDALEGEPRLRAAVLTGAGTIFVAGADIRQLRALAAPEDVEEFARQAERLFARIARARTPVIGHLVAPEDGRGGIDRFLARRSLPLPARRDG